MRNNGKIEVTLFSGGVETFAGADKLIDRGRELIERGGPYGPDEARIFGACFQHISGRAPRDELDARLQAGARAFYVPEPAREREPTPFDERIEAARLEAAAAAAMVEVKLGARFAKARAYDEAFAKHQSLDANEVVQAALECEEAIREYQHATDLYARANGKWNTLQRAASRWRALREYEATCVK